MPEPAFATLRARLLVLVGSAALPAVVLAAALALQERTAASRRAWETATLLARAAAIRQEQALAASRQTLAALGGRDVAAGGPACAAFLARQVEANPAFRDLAVAALDGTVVCESRPAAAARHVGTEPFFRHASETRGFSAAVGRGPDGAPALVVAAPLTDERRAMRGVAHGTLDPGWVRTLVAELGATGAHVSLTADGHTIASTDGEAAGRGGSAAAEVASPGPARLRAAVSLPGSGGAAAAARELGLPLLAVLLAGLGLAWLAGDRLVVRPVRTLLEAATGLASGDLAVRTGLSANPGLLGRLAVEFDDVVARLQSRQAEAERATEELRRSEARKTAVLQGALDGVITLDEEGRVTDFNPAAERAFRCARADTVGRTFADLVAPGTPRDPRRPGFPHGLGAESGQRVETTAVRADGSEFPAEVSVTTIEGQGPTTFCAFLRDITERRQADEALRRVRDELQRRVEERTAELKEANEKLVDWVDELQQRAQDLQRLSEFGDLLRACHGIDEAYAVVSRMGPALFPSHAAVLCMLSPSHPLLESVAAWGDPPPVEQVFTPDDCWALRRGRPHVVERDADARLVCPHVGRYVPAETICVPMMAQGAALGVLHLAEQVDPADRVLARPAIGAARRQLAVTVAEQLALALSNLRLQESLREQAIRDPLTGLFNRRYMEESLERELRRAARRGASLGVVMLDVDHFKRFNDRHGHPAGDTLLREMGSLLQGQTRGEDLACRYGGEEFVLILVEASLQDTHERASQLRAEAHTLRIEHGREALGPVTLSLGVAVYPDHGTTAERILAAADAALYRAKASGRDRVMVAEGA